MKLYFEDYTLLKIISEYLLAEHVEHSILYDYKYNYINDCVLLIRIVQLYILLIHLIGFKNVIIA